VNGPRRIWVHPLEVDSCICRALPVTVSRRYGTGWPFRPESSAAVSQAVQTAGIRRASSRPEPQYVWPFRGLWFVGRVRSPSLPVESHGRAAGEQRKRSTHLASRGRRSSGRRVDWEIVDRRFRGESSSCSWFIHTWRVDRQDRLDQQKSHAYARVRISLGSNDVHARGRILLEPNSLNLTLIAFPHCQKPPRRVSLRVLGKAPIISLW
jgi:hypothetical protein